MRSASARAARRELRRDRGRRDGACQDVLPVLVLDRRIGRLGAVRSARRDHRYLALELDPGLENADRGAEPAQAASTSAPGSSDDCPLPS